MAKKKETASKSQATHRQVAGKSQASRRQVAGKSQADTEKLKAEVKALVKEKFEDADPLDICYVYADGDNIETVAKLLTGHSRKAFALCEYSGVNLCDVKPGTVLRWPHGC